MNVLCKRWLAALLAGLVAAPARRSPRTRVRRADEKCIERCDIESDQCMADSNGDPDKMQACDDKYSECLKACDA